MAINSLATKLISACCCSRASSNSCGHTTGNNQRPSLLHCFEYATKTFTPKESYPSLRALLFAKVCATMILQARKTFEKLIAHFGCKQIRGFRRTGFQKNMCTPRLTVKRHNQSGKLLKRTSRIRSQITRISTQGSLVNLLCLYSSIISH